jgi:hypothetical protein
VNVQINLPESMRHQIIKDLISTPKYMFSEAASWVLTDICDTHWMEFKVMIRSCLARMKSCINYS